ncbi:MAG: DUF378 domain-containing protein [Patescibacteria group bacterium]
MSKGKMCSGHMVAWVLVLVGALNWGLVGGFGFNLVNSLLGNMPMAEKVVYILVGLSAVMMLLAGKCKMCGHGSCGGNEGHGCGCGNGEQKM